MQQDNFEYPIHEDALYDEEINTNVPAVNNNYQVKQHLINSKQDLVQLLASTSLSSTIQNLLIQNINKYHPIQQGDKIILELIQSQSSENITEHKLVKAILDGVKGKSEFMLAANGKTFLVKTTPPVMNNKLIAGTIKKSFYSSARQAGADANMIKEFINLLSYSVDFQRGIKPGDRFKILYENVGKKKQIVFASLITAEGKKEVIRYKTSNGVVDYFDAKGQSVKKSLLRTPINGAKISSGYGMRNHPVYGYSKMHQGVDFSAPRGTPILAAGDGIVKTKATHRRGYGNYVEIQHNKNYSTLYAHMSKFANLALGAKVKQGQVIGYVGDTGTATGPHLHYEVIVNGRKVNPAKFSIPKNPPLSGKELARFKQTVNTIAKIVVDDKITNKNKTVS